MKGAARRLAAAVEAIRVGGGSIAEQQAQQKELVQALIVLQRLWKPELLTNPTPTKKRSGKSNAALFQLLLATLIVYSGGHVGNSNAGAAGGSAGVTVVVQRPHVRMYPSPCVRPAECGSCSEGESMRLVPFHAEALKIVNKTSQDKVPEVRIAAARLLQVVAERTSVSTANAGAGGSQGGSGSGNGNGNGSGSGSASGSAAGASTGGSASASGVSLDSILQITAKGMDDVAPEARRAYSVVVGVVLANGSGSGKSKTGFKLHVPGINLPSSLSRRKAATVDFSTIANVVLYFKDMVTSKYLSTNPNQSHGGILASFSIALCSMFEHLPPDSIAESQIREVMDATLAILDYPFALGDLTRARNAVGFVLRYGLNGCLTERQQEVLLGAYLLKLKDETQAPEPNHHKILSTLVEMSHMFHSMGEASVTHAREASDILQGLICHEKQSVRFQAAVALASLVTATPYRLKNVLMDCLQGLRDTAEYLMRGGSDVEEGRNTESAEKTEDGQDEGSDMQSKAHLYAIKADPRQLSTFFAPSSLTAKRCLYSCESRAPCILDGNTGYSEQTTQAPWSNRSIPSNGMDHQLLLDAPPIYSDAYIVLLDLIAEFTTAQALTSLRHSSLVPAKSTYLKSVLSSEDNTLDVVTLSRLEPGDYPSPLYSRELNHVLGLQQQENALTDTELEVQYLDTFWRSMAEKETVDGVAKPASCSPFTYVRLVDVSVLLFGRLFHFIPEDLQLRCLQHYAGALSDVRADCEVNVCSLLFAVIAEARRLEKSGAAPTSSESLSATSWPLQMQTMLCEMIASHCKGLIIELEKRLVVDKLPQGASTATFSSNADLDVSVLSAGAAFALACIKRVCGSRISIDTGLVFRFAGECSQPLRTWILHSWGIILESVNSTGGDYEHFVSSTFSLMEAHVLAGFVYSKVNKRGLRWQVSTKVALGRIINDVVATLGPELGGSSDRLNEFYSYWMLIRQDGDARVELEFLRFLEQVVVFAPSRFQSADLRYILRIISDTALLNSASPSSRTAQQNSEVPVLSPPSGPTPSLVTFGNFGELFEQNGLVNVGVYTNGWSRSILQNVGLSCIRTLVERDPTLIRRQNLFCLLFSALHVEYNELTWIYLPGLHGMWDVLSFAVVDSTSIQRNSISVLQSTALALLDVEGGDHERAEPCLWALLCRSIAIGESASTSANTEQLMMSPKGASLGIQATANTEILGDDDDSTSWSPVQVSKADASSLAIATQVNTWRATKASVGDLIALMPPLSRQVRHFAVECVLRVFELMTGIPPMTTGVGLNKQLHFDLAAARRYFFDMLSAGEVLPVSAESNIGNFLFATGDAYLLDPYRAQLSSALRHALKQVQVESSPLPPSLDKSEERYFYAPLLLEAHGIAGACVSAHLIQDKVGLGRILRAVVTPDYGHAHFIGDELTRTSLSLANLASVGELLTSSATEAIAQKDVRDDERRAIATSPLVKAMTSGLSETTEYLFKCWMDSTFAYGVVMQGCAQWAELDTAVSATLLSDEVMVMPALQMPIPPIGAAANAPAAALSTSKALRTLYKRYWPRIVNAMATLEVYWPKAVSLCSAQEGNIPKWSSVLLSSAIFHVNANARDRMEDEGELPAVLRSIPLLLRALLENPLKQGCSSSSHFPVLLTTALNTLMLASKRCSGPAQVEALKAMFSCLSRENLAFAREMCLSGEDGHQRAATLFDTVAQAGLCPTEVVCQLCDATEQTRHARAVSVGSRTTGSRRSSVASVEDTKHMTEIVQFATSGIVLLHTTEEARHGVVRSVALVQQIICSVAGDYHSSSVKDAVVTLSRASTESVLALVRAQEEEDDSAGVLTRIKSSVRSCFEFLAEWLKVDVHTAPGFSMQIVANYAVSFPVCLQVDAERFHNEVTETTSAMLEEYTTPGAQDEDAKKQQHAASAELLRGLHAVVKKLVDVRQISILNRYLVALGPSLVEFVAVTTGYPETPAELDELDKAEALLRLLTTQLNDRHGSAFVHMLLPRLATVLSHPTPPAADNAIPAQVPGIVARLLLCFAQTHASAFKEAVAAMSPTLRGVLETALRLALTGSVPAAGTRGQPSLPQVSSPAAKLDLSRYN
ncbi:Armadillo-type fold [Phytophthora cactorum]|nr:Armadillo-type fold [Phytophthora cactorum]